MAKQIFKNGNTKWIVSMIVLIIGIGSLFGRQFQRLDHLDGHIDLKADIAVVDLKFDHINEKLDRIISKLDALIKDETRLEK